MQRSSIRPSVNPFITSLCLYHLIQGGAKAPHKVRANGRNIYASAKVKGEGARMQKQRFAQEVLALAKRIA